MYLDINIDDINSDLLNKFIGNDINSPNKNFMIESEKYFKVNNTNIDERKKMMMLFDKNENPYLKQDFSKANNKVKHAYLQELINQCTNYLVGKPIKIDYKENVKIKDRKLVDEKLFKDNNFLEFIQKIVTHVQLYGVAYMRIVLDINNNIKFISYDPKEMIMFYNEYDDPTLAIRYYTKQELKDNEIKKIKYAEVFNKTKKITWVQEKGKWEKVNQEFVYADKIVYTDEHDNVIKENVLSKDINIFPIIEWKFNDLAIPTLANIKDFIDLQDTNLSDLANNVEDIQDAIWILENYNGQNLQEFMEDLKVRKAIKVGNGGSVNSKTIEIPIEARNKLYELCEKNIYKFGFGINFSERDNLGNVSGVGLKWSYAPLEQKSNSIENNGQDALNNFFNILFNLLNINNNSNDVEFSFDRTMIINEQEKTSTVMSATSQLSRKTILTNLPMVKDVDEEMELLKDEDEYEPKEQDDFEDGKSDKKDDKLGHDDISDDNNGTSDENKKEA